MDEHPDDEIEHYRETMGTMADNLTTVTAEREMYRGLADGRERLLTELAADKGRLQVILEATRKVVVVFDQDRLQDASEALQYAVDQLVAELRAYYVGQGEDPDVWLNQRYVEAADAPPDGSVEAIDG